MIAAPLAKPEPQVMIFDLCPALLARAQGATRAAQVDTDWLHQLELPESMTMLAPRKVYGSREEGKFIIYSNRLMVITHKL